MTVAPVVLMAELAGVLALALVAAALWSDRPASGASRGGLGAVWRGYSKGQRATAKGLGLSDRGWMALRALAGSAGLLAGSLTGIWTVALAGGVVGFAGLPWLLSGRAARRHLQMERALAGLALTVRNLMDHSNLALDRALREAARAPSPELGTLLAPLAGDTPIADALVEVARRAGSPLADMLVTAALIARTHNPMALVRVTDQVLLPLMDGAVAVQEETHATLAQQRSAAVAIGAIMVALFAAVMRVPAMHEYYSTAAGQLVLAGVMLMYLGLVSMLSRIARPAPWVEWDIDAVRREAEALVG